MTTKTFATEAGGGDLEIGAPVIGGTPGSVLFIDSAGDLAEDNPNFFYDETSHFLGLGITSPQNRLHIDAGTATASYLQFTAGATTGQTSSDGFTLGVSTLGDAEIRQQESLDINIFTSNVNIARFRALGRLTLGDVAESIANPLFFSDQTIFAVMDTITAIGVVVPSISFIKILGIAQANIDPSADTNSGFGSTLYAGQGTFTNAGGTKNYSGGFPLGNSGLPVSVIGGFGSMNYTATSGTFDGGVGVLFTASHYGFGGASDAIVGGLFDAGTSDDSGGGFPTGSANTIIGGLFVSGAGGVSITTCMSAKFNEPIIQPGPVTPPTITNQTAAWINGTFSVTSSNVASAASITNMAVLTSFVRLTGSTATTLHGIHADTFSKTFWLYNLTGQTLTIKNQSATEGTAANRIITMTGADITTTGDGAAFFQYDTTQSRWICLFFTA